MGFLFKVTRDEAVDVNVDLHCLGGFAVTMQYGLPRGTSDIDVIAVVPNYKLAELQALAGEGSVLHNHYGVYLDPVTVAQFPENYESRLIPMWPKFGFRRLRLFALEAHDLALTKLDRNVERRSSRCGESSGRRASKPSRAPRALPGRSFVRICLPTWRSMI